MKKNLLFILSLALMVVGCQTEEFDPGFDPDANMVKVTLSAGMPSDDDTKASLDTRNGHFAWQENDQISVLATDGKFYTLTLAAGAETASATFEGLIPEGYTMTTVAVYPPMLENGAENTIYDAASGKLTYTLSSEYDYVEGSTNVPMVAVIEEGSTSTTAVASFKQIGSVVRFPINALPKEAKIVFTVKNLNILLPYDVVPAEAGTTALEANVLAGVASSVTVNYSSEFAGRSAEINIPVPTGTYGECQIEVFDAEGETLVKKEYDLDRQIGRAVLLRMNAINAGPMTISEVWPYFVDARVLFSKFEGVDRYAIYIDDIVNPVVVRGEEVDGVMQAVIGGKFAHNSTHTIKVATVVNGLADETTMSEPVTFTTGGVYQMTYNTGTKFICAGWDDVAVGPEHGTYLNDGKWSLVPEIPAVSSPDQRGYHVQLFAEDKETIIYDEIPFDGQSFGGSPFISGPWLARINGTTNTLYPTSLSFGWLEPETKYYFRVRTLSEPVVMNTDNGNFKDETILNSARGGSAWSEFVEMSTDPEYVMGDNDVFHEGFDDIMYNADIGNMAAAAVPQLLSSVEENYDGELATQLQSWLRNDFQNRYFSEQDLGVLVSSIQLGLTDNFTDNSTPRIFNETAGSVEGWSVKSEDSGADAYPSFGAIRLGKSATARTIAYLRTPSISSSKLSGDKDTPCELTIKVSPVVGSYNDYKKYLTVTQYRHDGIQFMPIDFVTDIDYTLNEDKTSKKEWSENYLGVEGTKIRGDYSRTFTWFEVKVPFDIRNGDYFEFNTSSSLGRGMLMIGDVKIELTKGDGNAPIDPTRNYGTAPDGTDYDIWGMGGVMPVTFWMGPPQLDQFNAEAMTAEDLATLKTTYFDPIVEGGYTLIELCNPYPASMKVLLQWCAEAGVKMIDKSIGAWDDPQGNVDRIVQYADNAAYAGLFVGKDEPGYVEFPEITTMNAAFKSALGTKARTVNLFPSYANTQQLNCGNALDDGTRTITSYEDYVQAFVNQMDMTDRKFALMFDHYCLNKSDKNGNASRGQVKSYQYRDLDIVRSVSLEKRVPFIQITHGRPQWDPGYSATIANNDPTWTTDVSATALPAKPDEHVYDEQRWLVWSQLALGSKGVSYFCYWTPNAFKGGPFSFHVDGTKTRMYDILKNINQEIQPIGQILMKCHADGAIMTNPAGRFVLYTNENKGLKDYGPVLELTRGNAEDVVAGCFRDAFTGEYKLLVTHKAPATTDDEAATASIATLKLDKNMVTRVKLHTVTLNEHNAAATTVVTEQSVADGTLSLSIPDGTAVLVEFPETANVSYN